MKKTIILLSAALAIVACMPKQQFTPLQEEVRNKVEEIVGEPLDHIEISEMVKVDSSSFREEIARRKSTFELKAKQVDKLVTKYIVEGKKKNAQKQRESYEKALGIIASLDSVEVAMGTAADEIAFYDYKFSVHGKNENSVVNFEEAYAAVTPEGKIISFATKQKDLRKATGVVIPGYDVILHGESEE